MLRRVNNYLKSNSRLLKSLMLVYIFGAALGIVYVYFLAEETHAELFSYVLGFLELYDVQNVDYVLLIMQTFMNYFKSIFVIWVLGASLVGSPMIFAVPIIRGFSSVFSITFIILCFGYSGIWFALGAIAVVEFVFILPLIICCTYAVNFSISFFNGKGNGKYGKRLAKYTGLTAVFVIFTFGLSVVESYLFMYLLPILI